MEEIFSLPPLAVFDNNYQTVLEFMDTLGNPKFKIAGDVNLSFSNIESLGNLVEVEGYLELHEAKITSLPDNLHVGNSLFLNSNITSLPDNLKVGGNLYVNNTNMTSLPNNLTVGGDLDLSYTNITSIPDNLKVGGSLYLRNTNITSLPDNLKVGGSLDLKETPISKMYSKNEIRKMIEDKGGFVNHNIYI